MEAVHQETEGLLSPLVRDARLRRVAARIKPHSTVLDLACGNGYLGRLLPSGCRYLGVDRMQTSDEARFERFLLADLMTPETPQRLRDWVGGEVDVLTCAAFLEHIQNPAAFIKAYRPLLAPDGRVVGTTPHPRGRKVHDTLARLYLCSSSGAAEHERFLSHEQLVRIGADAGGHLEAYQTFLFGLNQLFVYAF